MSYQSEGIRHIEINKRMDDKNYDTDDIEDDFEKTYSSDDAITRSSQSDSDSNTGSNGSDNEDVEFYKREDKNNVKTDSEEEEKKESSIKKTLPAKKSVNFDSLLKAVIDISDRIEDQEKKLKQFEKKDENQGYRKHFPPKGARPKTAVLQYRDESEYSSFDAVDSDNESLPSMISRGSSASRRRRRPQSSAIHRKSTESPPFRTNMSFSNEKVKSIDAENQRLLKQLLQTKMSKPAATATTFTKRKPQTRAQSASSINRARRQQEIDRENLRLLNKLQNVKPTGSLVRRSLLTDHTRHEQYSNRLGKGKPRPSSAASSTSSVQSTLRPSSGRSTRSNYFDATTRASSASSSLSRRSNRDRLTQANIERQKNWDDRW